MRRIKARKNEAREEREVQADDLTRKIERFSFETFRETESWDEYEAQFLLRCRVKGLGGEDAEEARRDLLLLAYVGPTALKKVKTFLLPKSVYVLDWDEVSGAFKSIYKPKKTIFAARLEFEQCTRQENEPFADFVVRLKELASYCGYENSMEERVRDRFAGGCEFQAFEMEIRQRWPDGTNENKSKLTLEQLLTLAETMERARKELNFDGKEDKFIGKLTRQNEGRDKKKQWNQNNNQKKECSHCGFRHDIGKCPAIQSKCFRCDKIGHFARQCKATTVRKLEENEEVQGRPEVNIQKTKIEMKTKKIPRATSNVEINGQEVRMEFDSGARASMIGISLWKKIGTPRLERSTSKFVAYGSNTLDVKGECVVVVRVANQIKKVSVAVVNGEEAPLFGLPWILAFNMGLPSEVKINKTEVDSVNNIGEIGKAVISKFSEVFTKELGTIKGFQARIHMKEGAKPKSFPARRVPFPMKKRIEQELERLVKAGILEAVDPAVTPIEWATPTVNVEKPNGDIRICGDFRVTLNPNMILESALLPTFEELTSKLANGKLYSVIDLRDAYLQLEVCEEHRAYLTIATHQGYFRYRRLPFGVSASAGIFQRYMEGLLKGISHVGVLLDDIIITGETVEEHMKNLEEVLMRLKNAGMKAKEEKCKFIQKSVKYLGHKIDEHGIHPLLDKVKAIQEAPAPINVKQLRSFLGSINYYERFVPRLHEMCACLHRLTGSRAKWRWSAEEEETFQRVKSVLSCSDTVVPYDETLPLVLVCDASEQGVGSVLMHRFQNAVEKPIAFASRTLDESEKRYANIDREALAILFAVRKFHQYIYGREFILVTDHKPLQRIFGTKRNLPKVTNNRLMRWAIELNQYQYEIEYRKGEKNVCADALSRLAIKDSSVDTEVIELNFLNMSKIETLMSFEKLKEESSRDKEIKAAKECVMNGWPEQPTPDLKLYKLRKDELAVEDEILLMLGRIVVPTNMRKHVLRILHCGHPGIAAMRSIARKDKCNRCIVMYEKHTNVLQYKETYCETDKSGISLDYLCSNINGDAPLFSMFRVGAKPVTCPFKNPPFSVVYNKGHGDCGAKEGEPPSKAESCTDDTRLVFKFQACPDVPGTESAVEELECLGTWKESSNHYLVGRLHHKIATTDEERYRCFVYHRPESHFYEVAQSGEATCSGMVSPVDGSRTFKLTRETTHNRCKFPQWVTQHTHWRSLDYSHSFHFSHKNASLRITSRSVDSKTEIKLVCYQIINQKLHNIARIVVHVVSGCDNGYRCMTFYRRDNHVIQMQQSVLYNDPSEAGSCASDEMSPSNTITMITAGMPVGRCPLEGRYTPIPGPISTTEDSLSTPLTECRQQTTLQSLSVGCHSEKRDTMEFQSNCRNIPATSYSCHGSWRDNATTYVVGSPVSRHSTDSRHYCFIFTYLPGTRSYMLQRVAETCTVSSPVEWTFNITEIGKCSEANNAMKLHFLPPALIILLPIIILVSSRR